MKAIQNPNNPKTSNRLTIEEIEKVYKELGINEEQEIKHFQDLNKLAMNFKKKQASTNNIHINYFDRRGTRKWQTGMKSLIE